MIRRILKWLDLRPEPNQSKEIIEKAIPFEYKYKVYKQCSKFLGIKYSTDGGITWQILTKCKDLYSGLNREIGTWEYYFSIDGAYSKSKQELDELFDTYEKIIAFQEAEKKNYDIAIEEDRLYRIEHKRKMKELGL